MLNLLYSNLTGDFVATANSGAKTITFTGGSVTVNNAGDSNTFPVVTFNGPLTSPYINNTTTGEVFKVNRTLASGEVVVVDMQNKTMVLNATTNALQYFDSTNTWLSLTPG